MTLSSSHRARDPVIMLRWNLDNNVEPAHIRIEGKLDQEANLDALCDALQGQIVIDLAGISAINSCGVREWIEFVRALDRKGCELILERCSVHVVDKLNLVLNFRGDGKVRSVYAPYICESCFVEDELLIDIESDWHEQLARNAPRCAQCGEAMELDHIQDEYFAFADLLD